MLERGYGFATHYFTYGRTLLRAAENVARPNGERLEEFRDSALPRLRSTSFQRSRFIPIWKP
jgi:hypothetical protein